jgi:hypothetical protein
MATNKNAKLLKSFVAYCHKHPELRFWQALHNWSGVDAIIYLKDSFEKDTFDWKSKNEFRKQKNRYLEA